MSLVRSSRPQRAVLNYTTAANQEVVAAITGRQIVVLNIVLAVASGNTVTWKSGTTAISGPISESYTAGDAWAGLLETVKGEALVLTTATTDQVSGHITYVVL
jgi:hypothetical protein